MDLSFEIFRLCIVEPSLCVVLAPIAHGVVRRF